MDKSCDSQIAFGVQLVTFVTVSAEETPGTYGKEL
jgi:hypothetical protein